MVKNDVGSLYRLCWLGQAFWLLNRCDIPVVYTGRLQRIVDLMQQIAKKAVYLPTALLRLDNSAYVKLEQGVELPTLCRPKCLIGGNTPYLQPRCLQRGRLRFRRLSSLLLLQNRSSERVLDRQTGLAHSRHRELTVGSPQNLPRMPVASMAASPSHPLVSMPCAAGR